MTPDWLAKAIAEGRVTEGPRAQLPRPTLSLDVSEAAFQLEVIDLAHAGGWAVAHFRRVKVQRGDSTYWETPVAADGKGFPDLLLCRNRLVVAELKRDSKSDSRLKPEQAAWRDRFARAGVEWHCWRPSMWDQIREVLR